MTGPALDVAVVGDGPAGLALAAACARHGLAVAVVGEGRPWTATYGMWVDDVPDLPTACFGHVSPAVVVQGRRRHVVERPYGVVDDERLRGHLAGDLDLRVGRATRVQHFTWGSRIVADGGDVDARLVVDASGRAGLAVADLRRSVAGSVADGVRCRRRRATGSLRPRPHHVDGPARPPRGGRGADVLLCRPGGRRLARRGDRAGCPPGDRSCLAARAVDRPAREQRPGRRGRRRRGWRPWPFHWAVGTA